MKISLNILKRSRNGRYRLINSVLSAAAVICVAAFLKALWQPAYALNGAVTRNKKPVQHDIRYVNESRAAYNVIVEKDLFSRNRQKYIPQPIVARPPAPKPPPKLVLIGTVLGGGGEAAIIDYPAGGLKSSLYRIGDDIEGFVITEIGEDSVLLKKQGEVLKVNLRQSIPFLPSAPNTPAVNTTPLRLRPQAAIPQTPEPLTRAR